MKSSKLLSISILVLAVSIILGPLFIGYTVIKSLDSNNAVQTSVDKRTTFNLEQVADYLNMTQDDVLGIIQTEKQLLDSTGSFTGTMFPYFTVNKVKYFDKSEIDSWLAEVASEHREYNTQGGFINN